MTKLSSQLFVTNFLKYMSTATSSINRLASYHISKNLLTWVIVFKFNRLFQPAKTFDLGRLIENIIWIAYSTKKKRWLQNFRLIKC